MNKLVAIFVSIVLLSIGSFAILWAVSPNEEKERTIATQGIRLVGSAVFYSAENSSTPNTVRVGDLLIGQNEQVFRINEIRKSQSNMTFVVVSWKYITDYTSYEEYLSEPYTNYATYELNKFAFNKNLIREPDLKKFYTAYREDLAKSLEDATRLATLPQVRRNAQKADSENGGNTRLAEISDTENSSQEEPAPQQVPNPDLNDRIRRLKERSGNDIAAYNSSAPRNLLRAVPANETIAYSTAEVSVPEDMDEHSEQELNTLLESVDQNEQPTDRQE